MNMWRVSLQLATICVSLQVAACFRPCTVFRSRAHCFFRNLTSVPPLPPDITHLFLAFNHIGEMNSSSLSGLEQLQQLDLGWQAVPLVIRNNAFSRQRNLKELILHSNAGLRLEPQAFVGLSGLQTLDLGRSSLNESILRENLLQPLSSLDTLNLFGNRIARVQPSAIFANMSDLKEVNLKLNPVDRICESDLVALQGKHFEALNLESVQLREMFTDGFDWQECGNPFRGMSFQTLDLSNNGFSVNGLRQFLRAIEGTKMSYLKLSGHMGAGFSFNNLLDPDHNTFASLRNSSVLTLDLSHNRIFALQRGVFSALGDVVNIDVSKNRVNQINRNAFEGLQGHLASLNLSHNLLGEIYSHTFDSLVNLQVLDLSCNHIGALGSEAFGGLPKLRLLNLTGNALRDLGFPAALPRLDHLLLSNNRLTQSSVTGVAEFAHNVQHLDLEDNRFTDLANVFTFLTQLKHLKYLFFGGNSLRECTPRAPAGPNRLQVLDLHRSSLQSVWAQGKCLNVFDHLGRVITLDLSSNALRSLPQGIFKGLTSVVQMDLSSNSLTNLHPDVLPQTLKILDLSNNFIASPDPHAFRSLGLLDLAMNRFHCNGDLTSFLTWLNTTNLTFQSPVQELRCEFPSRFNDVPLLDYFAQVKQD